MKDEGCICRGNWRKLVLECEPLFGKIYQDEKGAKYRFFGLVHDNEDYYYGMYELETRKALLASCVGSLETFGLKLAE